MKNILTIISIILLGGCVSASFEGLDKKDESNFIKSDSQNAVYEEIAPQPTTAVVVEDTTEPTKTEKKVVTENRTTEKEIKEPVKKQEVAEKKPQPIEQPAERTPSIEVLKATVYFRDGSAVLENANKQIRDVAKFVKANKAKVKVIGHSSSKTLNTDPVSHKMANFNASLKRAESVKNALVRAGVKKQDIIVEALSDSKPAYLEVMPEGERLNRRAEIFVMY